MLEEVKTEMKRYKVAMWQTRYEQYYKYVVAENEDEAYENVMDAEGNWILDDEVDWAYEDHMELESITEEEE
tara:strand:- start:28 stop:243 length:216 start_codon:yes stop_codon:yes gene_type:complete